MRQVKLMDILQNILPGLLKNFDGMKNLITKHQEF